MGLKNDDCEEWVDVPGWGAEKVSKLSSPITEIQLRLAQIKMDIDQTTTAIKYQIDYLSRIIDKIGKSLLESKPLQEEEQS